MIHLRVIREPSDNGRTFGALYVNDRWQCWTLEDAIREPRGTLLETNDAAVDAWVRSWKVAGKTAIPAGRYAVKLTLSNRFKRTLPELLIVPGFAGIRIHAGNTEADTEGCLLVGNHRAKDRIVESKIALAALMPILQSAQTQGDPIKIDLENPPARYLAGN